LRIRILNPFILAFNLVLCRKPDRKFNRIMMRSLKTSWLRGRNGKSKYHSSMTTRNEDEGWIMPCCFHHQWYYYSYFHKKCNVSFEEPLFNAKFQTRKNQ
jgi:hypothetical protein